MRNGSTATLMSGLALIALLALYGCGDGSITVIEPPLPGSECGIGALETVGEGRAQWDVPKFIDIQLEEGIAVRPHLAAGRRGVYIVFHGRVFDEHEPAFPVATDVYVMHNAGAGWSDPINISGTATPSMRARVGVDLKGVPHVVWGERIGGPPNRPPSIPNSLFHVTIERGEWTVPDTVWAPMDSDVLRAVPTPVFDSSGALHLAVGGTDLPRFAHVRRANAVWSRLAGDIHGIYVDLATDENRMLYALVYPGASEPRTSDINSVFFSISEDGGATRLPDTRILRAGLHPAHDPRIVVGGDGRFHVIWTRDSDGDVWSDVVQHSHSIDGECWSEPVTLELKSEDNADGIEVVADRRGGLHLIVHNLVGGRPPDRMPALYYYWDGASWSDPEALFGGAQVGQGFGLALDDDGVLHLAIFAELDGRSGIHYVRGRPTGAP